MKKNLAYSVARKNHKIAYLFRTRPDFEDIIPYDVEALRIEVDENGLYTLDDLARVQDMDVVVDRAIQIPIPCPYSLCRDICIEYWRYRHFNW